MECRVNLGHIKVLFRLIRKGSWKFLLKKIIRLFQKYIKKINFNINDDLLNFILNYFFIYYSPFPRIYAITLKRDYCLPSEAACKEEKHEDSTMTALVTMTSAVRIWNEVVNLIKLIVKIKLHWLSSFIWTNSSYYSIKCNVFKALIHIKV